MILSDVWEGQNEHRDRSKNTTGPEYDFTLFIKVYRKTKELATKLK